MNQRATVALVGCLGVLILGVAAAAGFLWLLNLGSCTEKELALFDEFPQYSGRQIEPDYNPNTGTCSVQYSTEASEEEVFAYYSERLRERGWRVMVREPGEPMPTSTASSEGRSTETTTETYKGFPTIIVRQESVEYRVHFASSERSPEPPSGKNQIYARVTEQ